MPPILREGLAFPLDVARALHSGHPSEEPGLPSSGWDGVMNSTVFKLKIYPEKGLNPEILTHGHICRDPFQYI